MENRPLFRAGRAPRRPNEDKDRVAALLRRFEGGLLIRQDGRGVRDAVRTDTCCQEKGGEKANFFTVWILLKVDGDVTTFTCTWQNGLPFSVIESHLVRLLIRRARVEWGEGKSAYSGKPRQRHG